jgi:hypothetical protein
MAALLGTDEWAGKISIQVAGSTGAVLHSQQLSGRQDGNSPKSVRRLPMVYAGQFGSPAMRNSAVHWQHHRPVARRRTPTRPKLL